MRLGKQSIAELPVVQKQPDPVSWLKESLQMKYPNDAELLQITLEGDDAAQAAKIVTAVLDVFFEEVVEKGVADRAKKEQLLLKLRKEREAPLENARARLHTQERIMKELARDLDKIELEKQDANRIRRTDRQEAEASPSAVTLSAPQGPEDERRSRSATTGDRSTSGSPCWRPI